MLGRLISDCEYYLGYGYRDPDKLWLMMRKNKLRKSKKYGLVFLSWKSRNGWPGNKSSHTRKKCVNNRNWYVDAAGIKPAASTRFILVLKPQPGLVPDRRLLGPEHKNISCSFSEKCCPILPAVIHLPSGRRSPPYCNGQYDPMSRRISYVYLWGLLLPETVFPKMQWLHLTADRPVWTLYPD